MNKSGSVFGGVLLIAGSCIGAGMLALPVVTGVAGFVPSLVVFTVAWLFMTTTALLLLEANLTLGHDLSLISIAEKSLGPLGKALSWLLFLFLFYCLSIAYIAASGSILESLCSDLFGLTFPNWAGSLFFTLVFGVVLVTGTRQVDLVNRLLMGGLVLAYLALVFLGSTHVKPALLSVRHWEYSFAALPVLIVCFGFHNMIPSLAMYFKGDRERLRVTVLVGSLVPLLIYLIWEVVMLGIVPIGGRDGLLHAHNQGEAATEALRAVVGKSSITLIAEAFALFAIITSFLAQSLSLVDFLADGLRIRKTAGGRIGLVILTLAPPFAFAFLYPAVFIQALNIAGGIAAVILFGLFPALMIWVLRYKKRLSIAPILPSGRFVLTIVIAFALFVFALELTQELGLSLIPADSEAIP